MLSDAFRLSVISAIHLASTQIALADSPTVSPSEIVERGFLIYQVGSSVPFTGSVISTRYNGTTAYEENYVDGKLHGLRTEWDRLGNRISETTYENGSKTGPETFWYDNGQVMAVTHFLNGSYHGQLLRWCRNGQKRIEWSYANHMKNGPQIQWYANGQKRSEQVYSDDERHGLWIDWYPNGQIQFEVTYSDGKRHGPQAAWYANGQQRYEGVYYDGRRGDRFTRWYKDGQLHTDYKVDPTREVSITTIWFANGQKQCETVFSKSKGEPLTRTAWDESGNLLEIEGQEYLTYCKSALSSSPLTLRPGETYASLMHRRSAGEARFSTTRYSTVGNETTATEIELSDSEHELLVSKGEDAKECGLRKLFP